MSVQMKTGQIHRQYKKNKYLLYLLEWKMRIFLRFDAYIYGVVLKFMYEAPKPTLSNQIALNRTIWCQTKACISTSLCISERERSMTEVK